MIRRQLRRIKYISKFLLRPIKMFFGNFNFRRNILYTFYFNKYKLNSNSVLLEAAHGNKIGGNPYAVFKAMIKDEKYRKYKFIWVMNDDIDIFLQEEFKKYKNVIFVKRDTIRYCRYLATSKYLINDTTFPLYFRKKEGQIYVNTWHGTPIKTLGKDVKGNPGQHKNTIRNFILADYLVHPNEFTSDVISRSHDLDDFYQGKILNIGYPRIDLTYDADQEEIKNRVEQILNRPIDKKVILYAPTWRGELGDIKNINDEILANINQLSNNLPEDYMLLLKVHNLTYDFIKDNEELEQICIPNWFETNELLSIVDVLITDYSSICFDFMHLNRPIFYFAYDYNEYKNDRGLYLDLNELPGKVCHDSEELIYQLHHLDKYPENSFQSAVEEYCPFDDGQASKRLINAIFEEDDTYVTSMELSNKKRILIYGGSLDTNGITSSLLNLLHNIDYNKYDVTLMHSGNIKDTNADNIAKIPKEVRILYRMGTFNFNLRQYYSHQLLFNSGFKRKLYKKLIPEELYQNEWKRLLGEFEFDIAIDYSGYSPLWTLLFSHGDFKRKVIYLHSEMVTDVERRNKQFKRAPVYFNIIFNSYDNFDTIISVSQDVGKINQERLKDYANQEKFLIIENPIDFQKVISLKDQYKITEINNTNYLILDESDDFGIYQFKGVPIPEDQNINFVTIGRLSIEKDHEKLIRAFTKLHKIHPQTRLYIIGDGVMRNQLKQLIDQLDVTHAVYLVGRLSNPYSVVNLCDCFVLSSNYEGQGLAVLEALILNKPVISTDIPGPRELLQNNQGSLIENSEEGLYYAMKEYTENPFSYPAFDYVKYNENAMRKFYSITN